MWLCKNCQKNNEGNFCERCGAPRPRESAPVVQTTKNKGLIITLVISVVILATLLVGVIVTMFVVGIIEENDTSSVAPLPEEVVEEIEEEFENFPEERPVETSVPTPAPQAKNNSQQETFLERARQIEEYEDDYMETATTQADINYETGIVYAKWDALLNDVYQYLKETLPSSEFEVLRKEEIAWIKEKEAACEETAAEWEGGSGAPMAWNMTAIEYTKPRTYELIYMID